MTDVIERGLGVMVPGVGLVAAGGPQGSPLFVPSLNPGTTDLVASARVVTGNTDGGVRWTDGFYAWGDPCGRAGMRMIDPCDLNTLDPAPDAPVSALWMPYFLVAWVRCSTFGTTPGEIADMARRLLGSGSASALIEWYLWGDSVDVPANVNETFVSRGSAVTNPGPLPPAQALAELEQEARVQYPGAGRYMIHASPRLVSLWAGAGLLRKQGGTLLTYLDSIVVAGSGYTITEGAGGESVAYPLEWAAISGIVTVHLSDIETPEDENLLVNRDSNTITAMAGRYVAANWPPCAYPFMVQADVSK